MGRQLILVDRYPYHRYTILLGATRALAHIGLYIPIPRVAVKVRTFKHFGVLSWGRDTINSTSEIGGDTLREGIS